MKALNLKKFFLKKENFALMENIINLAGGQFSVLDNAGNLIYGKKPTEKTVFFPIKLQGVTIGSVSGKPAAENTASILSRIVESWSLERSLAGEILKKYKEHDLLYNINDKTSLCPKPQEIGNFIVKELLRIIKLEYASVLIFNEEANALEILAFYGGDYHKVRYKNHIEKINDSVFKSGKGEIINEITEKNNNYVKKPKEKAKDGSNINAGYSFMSVPLKTKGNIIGLINVCFFKKAHYYSTSDFKILSTVASYAANSIEITRIYSAEKERADKLQKKNKELNAIKEIIINENINLKQNLRQKFSPKKIIGVSGHIKKILDTINKIADISSNVLITGESGTGKELVAKAVHYSGNRTESPFVAINCSAIPETIFESELFGIEKGVATGVDKRKGKILEADKGTLFLDEIGDMPLSGQSKILRVIQDREVIPVGGSKALRLDIRIIAATNKDLKKEIKRGNFREDLFYRLNVINLDIPPLRSRKEDIPVLINYFLKVAAAKLERPNIQCSSEAIKVLTDYDWPGNIRELENEIERATALCFSEKIMIGDFSETIKKHKPTNCCNICETVNVKESEKVIVKNALAESKGNKTAAAKILGITREGLRKKMIRLGFQKRFNKKGNSG